MDTQTLELINNTSKQSPEKTEYSLSEIAEELAKDIENPDVASITINLFLRARAGEFDFSRLMIVPEESRKILQIDDSRPYSESHGGITARLHGQEFQWPEQRLKYFHDYDNGIKLAIREICIQNFFFGKNIIPDYEEMFQNNDFILDDEYTPYLELSEKQCKYLLNKYLSEIEKTELGLVTGEYEEWQKSLPAEYLKPELNNTYEKLPIVFITKEALADYSRKPLQINYSPWRDIPIFYEKDKSKNIPTILKEFLDYHVAERDRFVLALSKHLFISKEDLLHWLRLGRSTRIITGRCQYAYPAETFLGDIWENTPFSWNPYVIDSPHLSLKDAWKYYSDSHLWDIYVTCKAKLEGVWPVSDFDRSSLQSNYNTAFAELKAEWLEHFRRGKVKMSGYMINNMLKEVEIDTNTIEGLLSSNRLDFEKNEIIGGDITGIRVYKVKENIDSKEKYNNGYSTIYMDLMQDAINHFKITELKQPMKETLVDWFHEKQLYISGNIKEYMATMVRVPDMQKGGYYTGNKSKSKSGSKKGNTHKQ
jgi:hypothetical protein